MLSLITDQYDYYIVSQQDPRVEGYPLMESPQTAIILCSLYLIFVKYIGPAYMKNRKPLEIKRTIVVYNALQTLFSLYMFIQSLMYGAAYLKNFNCHPHLHLTDNFNLKRVQLSWFFFIGRFFEFFDTSLMYGAAYLKNFNCHPHLHLTDNFNLKRVQLSWFFFIGRFFEFFDTSLMYGAAYLKNFNCHPHLHLTDNFNLKRVQLSWFFFIRRFFEFFDTIFFILRKKNNQVTTLHVVHHSTVPLMAWVGVKIVPGGQYVFAGILNTFVHTFMYFYYMVAAMGSKYKKYLWWKKYMTVLQLTQFVIVIIHTINTLASGCAIPKIFGYLVLTQAVVFLFLFWNFYKVSFHEKQVQKSDEISKPIFDIGKYSQKYRKFFEMCIPNQHELYSDDDIKIEEN